MPDVIRQRHFGFEPHAIPSVPIGPYKPRGAFLHEDDEVSLVMSGFPPVDIFVAHNSPRGLHDRSDCIHNGFAGFGDYTSRARPSLFIHGHQHADMESVAGGTRVIGVHGFRLLELKTGEPGNMSGSLWGR